MNTEKKQTKNKNILFYNLIFIVICGGLFLFLWSAPKETTPHLPNDDDHAEFMTMDKKEAEKFCEECHSPEGGAPLMTEHPPKYRCLFCHKRS